MPQNSLLSEDPTYRSVTIHTEDQTPDLDGAWVITVSVESLDGEKFTVSRERWTGYMLDLYPTLYSEVASAFMFGNVGDLTTVVRDVTKAARRHARAHDRVGS